VVKPIDKPKPGNTDFLRLEKKPKENLMHLVVRCGWQALSACYKTARYKTDGYKTDY
jgi:hypothetical protein